MDDNLQDLQHRMAVLMDRMYLKGKADAYRDCASRLKMLSVLKPESITKQRILHEIEIQAILCLKKCENTIEEFIKR